MLQTITFEQESIHIYTHFISRKRKADYDSTLYTTFAVFKLANFLVIIKR